MMDERNPMESAGPAGTTPEAAGGGANDGLHQRVVEALCTVSDPEIPVNIYELGLVYDIDISEEADVRVTMTLTTPNCPVAESMPGEVEDRVAAVPGVRSVTVDLVWDPPWTPDQMSEAAKLELGFI